MADLPEISQVKVQGFWEQTVEVALMQEPTLLWVDDLETSTLPQVLRTSDSAHTTLGCFQSAHPLADLSELCREEGGPGVSLGSLDLLIQQSLVPRLCPHCREEYTPSGSVLAQLGRSGLAEEGQVFFRSRGCSSCRNSGHLGRLAVLEALNVAPVLREMVRAGRPEKAIRKSALDGGLLIPYSASAKVLMRQGELGATTALRFFGKS